MKRRHAQIQGDNAVARDFGAVQRGDAEMEQKMNRVLRACVEMRRENIIASIHDQGAGGNGTCELQAVYFYVSHIWLTAAVKRCVVLAVDTSSFQAPV